MNAKVTIEITVEGSAFDAHAAAIAVLDAGALQDAMNARGVHVTRALVLAAVRLDEDDDQPDDVERCLACDARVPDNEGDGDVGTWHQETCHLHTFNQEGADEVTCDECGATRPGGDDPNEPGAWHTEACSAHPENGPDLDECADCGGSTAPGTPDPHVCGEAPAPPPEAPPYQVAPLPLRVACEDAASRLYDELVKIGDGEPYAGDVRRLRAIASSVASFLSCVASDDINGDRATLGDRMLVTLSGLVGNLASAVDDRTDGRHGPVFLRDARPFYDLVEHIEQDGPPVEPCAATLNGLERCTAEHLNRGAACGSCDPKHNDEAAPAAAH